MARTVGVVFGLSVLFTSFLRKQQRRLTAKSLGKLKCPSTKQISIQAKLATGVNFSVERSIQWRYITLDSSNGRSEHSETRSKWIVTWATHFDNIVRNKGLREGLSSPPEFTSPFTSPFSFVSIEKRYQTPERVFLRLSEDLDFCEKYSAERRTFNSLPGVWISSWNTVSRVWYITSRVFCLFVC